MKKNLILLLVCAALSGNIFMSQAYAQDFKKNYVRLQYVNPIGQYSDYYSAGVGAEYGKHFYFNTMLFDVLKPGIDLTFVEFAINFGDRYNYNEQADLLNGKINRKGIDCWFYSDGGFLSTVGVKLGPVITYNIVDDLFADFYIKYAPSLVWGSRTMNFVDMDNDHRTIDDPSSMFVGFVHRFSMGLNLKYSFFTFGIELLFGKTTLNYGDEIVPEPLDPIPSVGDTWKLTDKKSMGLNTIKINVGYLF
ncbi:MAG: hypothetical protein LBR17_09015 [Bacteroidales bacterium]|jgi:hypothetical protein|nr:hypothetical protein [Bacteroidales bacterium]